MGDQPENTVPDTQQSIAFDALRGCVPVEFPADSQLTHPDFLANSIASLTVANDLYTRLLAFSEQVSVSLHEILLVAVRILHLRYSGVVRAAIGVNAYGKPGEALAICLQIEDGDKFAEVVRDTHKLVSSLERNTLPFEAVLPQLVTNRSSLHGVVLPVLVHLVNVPADGTTDGPFAMAWNACPSADNLRVDVSFDSTRFGPGTIQTFLNNLVDVFTAIVTTPDHSVDDIPFSHPLDQLVAANIPVDPAPIPSQPRPTLTQAFSDAVVAYHDLPALIDEDLTLTYHEVDVLTSALSQRILDVTKHQEIHAFVSFCIPSGAIAILTILAIVKSGAAYVPLDVHFPAERLESLVEDSGVSLVITTSESPSFNFNRERITHLDVTGFLDERKSLVAASAHKERDRSISPASPASSSNDAAYVLYTSGSTGKPKGVFIKQSSVVAFATNTDIFKWGPGHRIAQVNNIAWDASVADVWCTLLLGATLVCFDCIDVLNVPALARRFQATRIDGILLPTSVFRQFAAACPDAFRGLAQVVVGGEALDYASVGQARAAAPNAVIRNAYGPTEACVIATTFDVLPDDDDVPHAGPVPIGHPLKTCQVLVVDRRGRLVPPGVIGELIIGGEGIAEGYLNRPAETADAFVELHIDDLPGNTRFYRTGDAARWCDGQLQFMGRMNIGQIKISGQRLELSEIEATILRTELVAGAGVSYHKPTDGGDPSLVAYVVLDHERTPEVDDHTSSQDAPVAGSNDDSAIVETWRDVYDDMYAAYDLPKARADFSGWDSMITGGPIPKLEMTAWLHDTLRPFHQQRPRTAFEIGCGIGIFVHQILPSVDRMWAIEPSAEAAKRLEDELKGLGLGDKTSIWHAAADEMSKLPAFEADFAFMNSVVQYFPSEAYLHQSIIDIVGKCAPGGRILIGDVRSLPFASLLALDITAHRWQDELGSRTLQDLRDEILNREKYRSELLVDPSFFTNLRRTIPAVAHVEIVPKAIEYCNELSQFRYQVILHVNQEQRLIAPPAWHDYEALQWKNSDLENALRDFVAGDENVLAVEHIPNRFLSWELVAATAIFSSSSDRFTDLASVLPPRKETSTGRGWSAWDVERLAERYGVTVKLSVARQKETTTLDAVFIKGPLDNANDGACVAFKTVDHDEASLSPFATARLQELVFRTHLESSLHERLSAVLPSCMVPDHIFSVGALPLQTSGKLDRRQLAVMAEKDARRDVRRATEDVQDVLPADDMEARLCGIFGRLLSIRPVSPLADFFHIGGHSLLATRLKSALESEFRVVIPLRTIFSHPSPRKLAASIRDTFASAPSDQHVSLSLKTIVSHPSPSDPSDERSIYTTALFGGTHYPLSFAQQRLWFLSQLAYFGSQNICYNTPYFLKLEGPLNIDTLERTVQEIVSRHEILRTIFVEVDYAPATQIVDFCPRLEVVPVDPEIDKESIRALIGEYARRPFSLDVEPSFRATLFQLSQDHFYLLLCMHHILVDGFSFDVIRQELMEIYVAFEAGKHHDLPPLHIQYKEFAQWQQSEDFERLLEPQIEYWTKQLKGTQAAELPTDFPRPQHLSHEGKTYIARFPPELFTRIEQVCKQERVTMFMLLSAAFRIVQFQLTGQTDASFAFPIANRNRAETEKLIGFFVNTQILRLKVHPGMTFLELLQQARDLSMAAFEYQDMPFERVVSILNPARDLSRIPLAQIILAYQTVKTAPFAIEGVHASASRVDMNLTRFDMEIHFFPRADGHLLGEFVYSTDLFKEETIADLTDRMQKVLEQVVDNVRFSIDPPRSSSTPRQPTPSDVAAYLHDYSPCEFPLDFPRCSDSASLQREAHSFVLPPTVRDTLRASSIGEEELLTLHLSALSVLNHRYTRQEDITIGLTTSESQDIVPARLAVYRDAVLSSVLDDTRASIKKASEFSAVSIKDVSTAVRRRQNSLSSVVHVVLSNDSSRADTPLSKELGLLVDLELRYSNLNEPCYQLLYDQSLFRPNTIEVFCDNFVDILESILLRPSLMVEEIPFQHSARHLKLFGVPLAPPPPPPSSPLVDALKKSVDAHPDVLALQEKDFLLSYTQLNTASSLLAQRIVQISGDACEFVAMCIPPSALAVISILSIIKSGAAYVPLDVRYPPERLEMLLRESGARLLITTSQSPEFADTADGITRLDISDFLTEIDLAFSNDFVCAPRTDAAYVMYTSGSTGVPKGVPIMQSSVVALVSNTDVFPFQSGDRIGMINNLAWDASIIDIWCTLLAGATVVCFNRYDVLDPVVLAEQFQLLAVSGCFMSVALLHQTLDLAPQLFRKLRVLQVGGETSHYENLQRVKSVNPSIRILNAYGPTETCVFAATFWIDVSSMPVSGPVPIGRPMPTVQTLIVDTQGRLVPPGAVGELIIGGAGVGPGYLRRPKETTESFVELGFDELDQSVARYYRTGDAVRWGPDGLLHFVGRMNAGQIKIRGQRLELSEIEAAIRRTGLANDAAVVHLKSHRDKNDLLIVYAVAAAPTSASQSHSLSLRLFESLRKTLPSYMIPHLVRWIPTLPLTPNGKVDRHQLRARAAADADSMLDDAAEENDSGEPADEVEERLCRIIEVLLGRTPIRRSSNFFNAGGHSLLASRLVFRIQEAFDVSFTLMNVFNMPVVKAMAEKIREAIAAKASDQPSTTPTTAPASEKFNVLPLLVFSEEPRRPFLFCVPMATGLGHIFAALSRSTDLFNVIALNDPGYVVLDDLPQDRPSTDHASALRNSVMHTIENQAKYYYARIVEELGRVSSATPGNAPFNILGYSYGGHVAVEVARLAQGEGWTVNLFILDTSAHPVHETKLTQPQTEEASLIVLPAVMSAVGLPFGNMGEQGARLKRDIEARALANFHSLHAHVMPRYKGHVTLFRTESNAGHGFVPLVGSLDEVLLQGNHYHLLEEESGNLSVISAKVSAVIGA